MYHGFQEPDLAVLRPNRRCWAARRLFSASLTVAPFGMPFARRLKKFGAVRLACSPKQRLSSTRTS